MIPKQQYERFVKGLNSGRKQQVRTRDDLVMHLVFDARVMSPSEANKVVDQLISEGRIKQKDRFVDLSGLYDERSGMFVMKGKKGNTLSDAPRNIPKRSVRYVGPGHTQVNYEHRVLDIKFKETQAEFEHRQHLRRSRAAKNRKASNGPIFVDRDETGVMRMRTKSGRDASQKSRKQTDKGRKAIVKKKLSKDEYTLEDMRALLKDDHWEEVSGNKRWMYDRDATVKEFNRYLRKRI